MSLKKKDQNAIAMILTEMYSDSQSKTHNSGFQLTTLGRYLAIPSKDGGEPKTLMTFSRYGEPDEPEWPNYDENTLRQALQDAVNKGTIPDVPSVILPDGTLFEIAGETEDTDSSPEGYWY
jgi:hypothetical protein